MVLDFSFPFLFPRSPAFLLSFFAFSVSLFFCPSTFSLSLFLFPLFRFLRYFPSVFPFFLCFFRFPFFFRPSTFSLSLFLFSLFLFPFFSLFFVFFRYSPSVFPFFLCFFRFPFFFRPSTFPLMNRQPFGKRRKPFLKLQADFVR